MLPTDRIADAKIVEHCAVSLFCFLDNTWITKTVGRKYSDDKDGILKIFINLCEQIFF